MREKSLHFRIVNL